MEILFYVVSVAAAGWLAVAVAKRLSPAPTPGVVHSARAAVSVAPLLEPYATALDKTRRAKLDIELVPMARDDVTASKVGGQAYWPETRDYPRGEDGEPLFLLAQIDFAQAPKLEGYPEHGLLQFFIAGDDQYGADFDTTPAQSSIHKNFRVVFWPAPLPAASGAVMRTLSQESYLPMDPAKPRRMKFTAGSETIGAGDAGISAILGQDVYPLATEYAAREHLPEDDVVDALYTQLSRIGHKLGGYPYFTQEDPRQPGDPRVLLLQLDTDDAMMWGDAGVANFFIHPDDLARRDFSRVLYNWDCH
jgi:uncharacterized protein YwqG